MAPSTDAALVDRIDRLVVPPGQLALWSLGQAGFVLKGGRAIVYIDPYLSDSVAAIGGPARRFPIPIDPATIRHADLVLATHEHMDHADAVTLGPLLAASPRAGLITSVQGGAIALDVGVAAERVIVPRLGQPLTRGDVTVTAIPAAHYALEVDAAGQSRWMGFLIEVNGVTVYHSGDTLLIPEIPAALAGRAIDLALLPINGRDAMREAEGLIGNLLPGEAVALAAQVRARVLIGIHNDLFAGNRVDPGLLFSELDRRAPWQRCHLLQPGELYLYAG